MGGATSFLFFQEDSRVIIRKNIFQENFADFAGAIFSNNPSGVIYSIENSFLGNLVYTQQHILLGSGAVYNIGGTLNTIVISRQNLYFSNVAEYKGQFFKKLIYLLILGGIISAILGYFIEMSSNYIGYKKYIFFKKIFITFL